MRRNSLLLPLLLLCLWPSSLRAIENFTHQCFLGRYWGSANIPVTFYLDQEFINSPLHSSIFPIGTQDGFLLLIETLGMP